MSTYRVGYKSMGHHQEQNMMLSEVSYLFGKKEEGNSQLQGSNLLLTCMKTTQNCGITFFLTVYLHQLNWWNCFYRENYMSVEQPMLEGKIAQRSLVNISYWNWNMLNLEGCNRRMGLQWCDNQDFRLLFPASLMLE